MEYEAVIGLEVHVQLNTKTKAFCSCPNTFGAPANTLTCPRCQAHPGTLPIVNKEMVHKTIKAGLATNCTIQKKSRFARKHYFYPDLPSYYQITQMDEPICTEGHLDITVLNDDGSSYNKSIRINRIHMEEDAGKLVHDDTGRPLSYVDLNRAGCCLIECVSEPDISTGEEAYQYLTELKKIFKYIDVSDCNMEEGSLRCDANVSIRPKGSKELGVKTEVKNMNSFRNVRLAIDYEIKRQIKALNNGEKILQETRLYDAKENNTKGMRSKEGAADYRYFPDPDIPLLVLQDEEIENAKKELPELPQQKRERLKKDYDLPDQDIVVLTEDAALADYYEAAVKAYPKQPKKISNWIMVEVNAYLNKKLQTIKDFKPKPEHIAEIFKLIDEGVISGKIAKEIFEDMCETGEAPSVIVDKKGIKQVSDTGELEAIIRKVLEENPKSVADFKAGKEKSFGFLVGQTMKATKGQGNPKLVNEVLRKVLSE
ncbi:Asp-tRNA(Asn)/Glu-tRNA(Gln) amidotransferase subunit GatB [uncultured Brachyspira sp.]|uniref:Asp-tRNA(Asn)/Glu-tRNA(Gln) amidotransferase subunit GatB n=1 Tax=uncultured Brachyspira sp. TaxID=221953 RepID=UPI00261CDBCC|nr:Asp-tRNA(Asn)/Glu-tRNA(Gln) amidotransferase subunit GatB [uncultured Brachyspira sp.]